MATKLFIYKKVADGEKHGVNIHTRRPDLIKCEYCLSKENLKLWVDNIGFSLKIVCADCTDRLPEPSMNFYTQMEVQRATRDGSNIISYCAPIFDVINSSEQTQSED